MLKKLSLAIVAALFIAPNLHAFSTNDIQIWAGSGTNHAALIIEWNSPEVLNNTTVPTPIANKTMVWGYQFNGSATGTQMLDAVLQADPRLYVVIDDSYGTFVEGLGYNFQGNKTYGLSDGSNVYPASQFNNGILLDSALNVDGAFPLNNGDLFWSGYFGPNWNVWTELNDNGGFSSAPLRGTNEFWDGDTGVQGQWEFAFAGLDDLSLTDGSWIGFSVAAAGYDTNTADPATAAFNNDEQAPPTPDGTYAAYIYRTNDFATQVVGTSGISMTSPYNNPAAILGRPTLLFVDPFDGGATNRTSIIDDPYNVEPSGAPVITQITNGGQVTLAMGRPIYHNPANPYGLDIILYGNGFYSPKGGGFVSDETDLNTTILNGLSGHSAKIEVSQDATNWVTITNSVSLFPDEAYRWDDLNDSWTLEQMNPTKPLDPGVTGASLEGSSAAGALDQFAGASGGTALSIASSGLPWIQYIRISPPAGSATVIDSVAAVNPVLEGDVLSLTPIDLPEGITNLDYQNPADSNRNLITLGFSSLNETIKVSTVALSDFGPFAPVPGIVETACQITVAPVKNTNSPVYQANVTFDAGTNYNGNGSDLGVLQWNGSAWTTPTFTYNIAQNQVSLIGLTNMSAFVITSLKPQLTVVSNSTGLGYQFTPFPNATYSLLRSVDLVNWSPVGTVVPTNTTPIVLQDASPPAVQAFYSLKVTR
jgi:hypothetical protein